MTCVTEFPADLFEIWLQKHQEVCSAMLTATDAQSVFNDTETKVDGLRTEFERIRAQLALAETAMTLAEVDVQQKLNAIAGLRSDVRLSSCANPTHVYCFVCE